MKVKKNKTLYYCDHCNKMYQIKSACLTHEKKCSKSPNNNRACFDCRHLDLVDVSLYEGVVGGIEQSRKVQIFKCKKVNSFLYPPKVEHKGNAFLSEDLNGGDLDNIPMKKTCNKFERLFEVDELPF